MATEKLLLLPQFAFLPTSLYSPMDLSNPLALPTVLSDPSTIRFHRGSYDQADFGGIDLSKNPQKSSNGPFVWLLKDRSEASVTFVGKVIYSVIGDKTGPYFSLPEAHYVSAVVPVCHSIPLTYCLRCQRLPPTKWGKSKLALLSVR